MRAEFPKMEMALHAARVLSGERAAEVAKLKEQLQAADS